MDIETNLPLTGREHLGVFTPYAVGTRLYLNLPDGTRAGFTFDPQPQEQAGLVFHAAALNHPILESGESSRPRHC